MGDIAIKEVHCCNDIGTMCTLDHYSICTIIHIATLKQASIPTIKDYKVQTPTPISNYVVPQRNALLYFPL
jgi:translation initiation factor 2 alpha subunit (eIF-2alpha)